MAAGWMAAAKGLKSAKAGPSGVQDRSVTDTGAFNVTVPEAAMRARKPRTPAQENRVYRDLAIGGAIVGAVAYFMAKG